MNAGQLIINVLLTAGGYTLVGCGFTLIYSTTRFFHFAHGIVFTAGAYFAFVFISFLGLPFFLSLPLAIVLGSLLGCLMELSCYRGLRLKNSPPLMLLLASLGITVVIQNTISLIFGDYTRTIRFLPVEEGINLLGAKITQVQIVIILVSGILVAGLLILLKMTKMGKAIRAVANDPELASVSGIESDKVILLTFAVGSALAALAGIMMALDVNMTPTMGLNALLMGVVAVIIGGIGSIPGVAFGALLLAIAQHLGVWVIGSQWQDTIAFVILLIFLLLWPHGFFGRRLKKATI